MPAHEFVQPGTPAHDAGRGAASLAAARQAMTHALTRASPPTATTSGAGEGFRQSGRTRRRTRHVSESWVTTAFDRLSAQITETNKSIIALDSKVDSKFDRVDKKIIALDSKVDRVDKKVIVLDSNVGRLSSAVGLLVEDQARRKLVPRRNETFVANAVIATVDAFEAPFQRAAAVRPTTAPDTRAQSGGPTGGGGHGKRPRRAWVGDAGHVATRLLRVVQADVKKLATRILTPTPGDASRRLALPAPKARNEDDAAFSRRVQPILGELDKRIQELNRSYETQVSAAAAKPDGRLTQQVHLCKLLREYVVADDFERTRMLLFDNLGLAAFANATPGLVGKYLTQFELDCQGAVSWNKSGALEVEIGEIKMTGGKNQRKKAREQLTRSLLLYHRVARCLFGAVPITLTGTTFTPKPQRPRGVSVLREKVNVEGKTILLQTESL